MLKVELNDIADSPFSKSGRLEAFVQAFTSGHVAEETLARRTIEEDISVGVERFKKEFIDVERRLQDAGFDVEADTKLIVESVARVRDAFRAVLPSCGGTQATAGVQQPKRQYYQVFRDTSRWLESNET